MYSSNKFNKTFFNYHTLQTDYHPYTPKEKYGPTNGLRIPGKTKVIKQNTWTKLKVKLN